MKPPFKMRTETEMEKYRYETWDTKEPETIEWINSFEPNSVFFDVGANIGVYSLYAASLHPQLDIAAFEPMPKNAESLLANREANHFIKMHVYPWAVGSAYKKIYLNIPNDTPGESGSQVNDHYGIEVKMVSIDRFCSGFYKVDYVKIDIDGQELAVIHGMKKTLPRVKSILVEVSKASKQTILNILLAAGFTINNRFYTMTPHSRERREKEGIDAENIIFTR
jgi:FkbM family methyltransferase